MRVGAAGGDRWSRFVSCPFPMVSYPSPPAAPSATTDSSDRPHGGLSDHPSDRHPRWTVKIIWAHTGIKEISKTSRADAPKALRRIFVVCTLSLHRVHRYIGGLEHISACAMPEAVAEHGAGSEEWRTQIAAAAVEAALGASKELSLEREHALQAAEARALAAEEAASQLQEGMAQLQAMVERSSLRTAAHDTHAAQPHQIHALQEALAAARREAASAKTHAQARAAAMDAEMIAAMEAVRGAAAERDAAIAEAVAEAVAEANATARRELQVAVAIAREEGGAAARAEADATARQELQVAVAIAREDGEAAARAEASAELSTLRRELAILREASSRDASSTDTSRDAALVACEATREEVFDFSTQTPISPICRTPLFPISQNVILVF